MRRLSLWARVLAAATTASCSHARVETRATPSREMNHGNTSASAQEPMFMIDGVPLEPLPTIPGVKADAPGRYIVNGVPVETPPPSPATPSSADQIRSMRQEIDKTFQRHDPKQLATLFSSDCHFTAPSVHIDGSDALERFHGSLFLKRPDVILAHHTNRIAVNENWNVASEQGEWMERWTDKDGVTELRGTYLTMWKRENNDWREYSEIIVPETCTGGAYCH